MDFKGLPWPTAAAADQEQRQQKQWQICYARTIGNEGLGAAGAGNGQRRPTVMLVMIVAMMVAVEAKLAQRQLIAERTLLVGRDGMEAS